MGLYCRSLLRRSSVSKYRFGRRSPRLYGPGGLSGYTLRHRGSARNTFAGHPGDGNQVNSQDPTIHGQTACPTNAWHSTLSFCSFPHESVQSGTCRYRNRARAFYTDNAHARLTRRYVASRRHGGGPQTPGSAFSSRTSADTTCGSCGVMCSQAYVVVLTLQHKGKAPHFCHSRRIGLTKDRHERFRTCESRPIAFSFLGTSNPLGS